MFPSLLLPMKTSMAYFEKEFKREGIRSSYLKTMIANIGES